MFLPVFLTYNYEKQHFNCNICIHCTIGVVTFWHYWVFVDRQYTIQRNNEELYILYVFVWMDCANVSHKRCLLEIRK